jgi:hypothetical protein
MRLVYLSPVPWSSFAQRPHEFVNWFQETYQAEVLWIDPYPTRWPVPSDLLRFKSDTSKELNCTFAVTVPPWLTINAPKALPIEPLPGSGFVNKHFWRNTLKTINAFIGMGECTLVIGKPSVLALQVLRQHKEIRSHYDAMDDFPAFYTGMSKLAVGQREQKLAALVIRIIVSSTELTKRFRAHENKVLVARNACAIDKLPPISALKQIHKSSPPIIGYVGTIGHWFDWELVIAIASACPKILIKLIGPLHSKSHHALPTNIEVLPACSHADAIEEMSKFSIGLIPFKQVALTQSVDPIKYYEYRCLGLTVISSFFGEMALRGNEPGVFLVDKERAIEHLVTEALLFKTVEQEVNNFRKSNSWAIRFSSSKIFEE